MGLGSFEGLGFRRIFFVGFCGFGSFEIGCSGFGILAFRGFGFPVFGAGFWIPICWNLIFVVT